MALYIYILFSSPLNIPSHYSFNVSLIYMVCIMNALLPTAFRKV